MTDARNDAVLEKSIDALQAGSGVVFRHYHMTEAARHSRFDEIKTLCNQKSHILLLADDSATALKWGADGFHGHRGEAVPEMMHSAPVHNESEMRAANDSNVDLYFLSPVRPTRSHPGEPFLERTQVEKLIELSNGPVIVMGGMNADYFPEFAKLGAYGWAAIDALSIS